MATEYDYRIRVIHSGDRAVAFVKDDGPDGDGPLRGEGATPILALANLAETLHRWPRGGTNEWVTTTQGRAFVEECRIAVSGAGPTRN